MTGAAEIYIESSPGERRAGHLDGGGQAIAFNVDRPTRPRLAGGVYLARVRSVDKRMGAAFLDLGTAGAAMLNKAKDLGEGDAVTVQISRDAHDDKGPAATRQIVLWGRYLALQPGRGGGLQCVRALGQGKRRALALSTAQAALDDAGDLLLRGPAADADGATMADEARRLRTLWAHIQGSGGKAPVELSPPPDFVDLCLRDAAPHARIALDDRLDAAAAKALAEDRYPDLIESLAFHDGKDALFDAAGLSDVLEEALSETVAISGGGRLTVQETRALTAIDVDMGGGEAGASTKEDAIHRLNRRAAETIARQIVLRRLGGLIAVDFAGLGGRGKTKPLIDILRARLKGGDGHADVLGMTAAGLLEITRQRVGPTLADLFLSNGPVRPAPDAEAADILRRVLRLRGAGRPVADLSDGAAALLRGAMQQALQETERRLGQPIDLRAGAARPDVRLER